MLFLVFGVVAFAVVNVSGLEIYKGNFDYSTYYEGDSPIIILSQHGGSEKPASIPDRHAGCYDGENCLWFYNCDVTTPYARDSSKCGVSTAKDSYTRTIADCLRQQLILNISGNLVHPHLIINELHRSKVDSNREYGPATLNNSIAGDTWNEIHYQWMAMAKNATTEQYNWGLVLDIHGQASNIYNHLGYRIQQNELLSSDSQLNGKTTSTSIRSVAERAVALGIGDLSSIIRGNDSLGTYMNQTYGNYVMVPSSNQPNLGNESINGTEHYYQGAFSLLTHGSQFSGAVDAVQIEINSDIRSNLRQQFCQDFSRSITAFVHKWYDV